MKKIMFAMYSMGLGGVEKALIELLKELAKVDDWDITLLLLERRGEFLEQVPQKVHIKVCDIPSHILLENTLDTKNALKTALQSGNIKAFIRIVRDYMRHRNMTPQQVLQDNWETWDSEICPESDAYDIAVDFQGMGVFTTFYVAKYVKAPVKLTWIHNDISVIQESMEWQKPVYDHFNRVFCVSKEAERQTIGKLPFVEGKTGLFYNIIPKEDILLAAKVQEQKLSGTMKILTVGRLSYPKGYDIAIPVMKKLIQKGYDIDYYIVGEGEQRAELENLIERLGISDRIHLLGYQSNPYQYIAQCDIYFQPSRFEGFCITLGEAKILHKPIVTTDFAGAREQIINNENGLIIPCEEKAMFETLAQIIKDTGLQKEFSKRLIDENKMHSDVDLLKEFIVK